MQKNRISPSDAESNEGGGESADDHAQHFRLVYVDLEYVIERKSSQSHKKKLSVLKDINGTIYGCSLVAIMGPKGCGKSLFLQCLANRALKGRLGKVFIRSVGNSSLPVRSSFISKDDVLPELLTARECLYFSSKFQNSIERHGKKNALESVVTNSAEMEGGWSNRQASISSVDIHEAMADMILKSFHIEECADVLVKNLTIYQRRCLSIGQELCSKPNILFLDEPFADLDPPAANFLLTTLNNLIILKFNMLIIAAISNPPAKVFAGFNKILCLSSFGTLMYDGFPENSMAVIASLGVNCPSFYNPADFLLEVASGEYGYELVDKLTKRTHEATTNFIAFSIRKPDADHPNLDLYAENEPAKNIQNNLSNGAQRNGRGSTKKSPISRSSSGSHEEDKNLLKINVDPNYPQLTHFGALFYRSFLIMIRDPAAIFMRIFNYVQVSLLIGGLFNQQIGREDACSFFATDQRLISQSNSTHHLQKLMDNTGYLFTSVAIVFFASVLLTVLIFSPEMPLLRKEVHNGWHSVGSFYIARTLLELPLQIILPALYWIITYVMNGEPRNPLRLALTLVIIILIALTGQTFGLIFSAIFIQDTLAAIIVGPLNLLPMFLFANFFAKVDNMNIFFKILANLSPARDSFEGILVAIYGLNRCSNKTGISMVQHILPGWLVPLLTHHNTTIVSPKNVSLTSPGAILTPTRVNATDRAVRRFFASNRTAAAERRKFSSTSRASSVTSLQDTASSYVLKLFNLTDDRIISSIVGLTINLILLRIITWLLLKWRVKGNPK